jgi:hypothetical protein
MSPLNLLVEAGWILQNRDEMNLSAARGVAVRVEIQADRYSKGLPAGLDPRSRRIYQVHQPSTLADWLKADTLDTWVKGHGGFTAADASKPSSLRARLRHAPFPIITGGPMNTLIGKDSQM